MVFYILTVLFTLVLAAFRADYKIEAVRYGVIPQFPVAALVVGAPQEEKLDIPLVFWIIRGDDRNILFDCGFYRETWKEMFHVTEYVRPDEAV